MEKNEDAKSEVPCGSDPCPSERGEGGSVNSDKISWQHFPKSTSSRGSCYSSSEEKFSVSSSQTSASIYKDEKSPTGTLSSISSGPVVKTISQLQADHYLRIRCVFDFLNFLIGHLVCAEPEDPVQYLIELIDKCISARNGDVDPPLLFSDEHVKAVYGAFDPFGRGNLDRRQYGEAMRTLGLDNKTTPYRRNPSVDDKDHVKETFFMSEAKRCLLENFKKMTRIPKNWEENRLAYLRKMTEQPDFDFPPRVPDEVEDSDESSECSVDKNEVSKTDCFYAKTTRHEAKMKHEPEQLFLSVR